MTRFSTAANTDTLCDRIRDFTVLFGPLSREVLAHQNQAAIQQGDETRWRVQEQEGSQRAWLWLAVSTDAATFHIDPSRNAEASYGPFVSKTPHRPNSLSSIH